MARAPSLLSSLLACLASLAVEGKVRADEQSASPGRDDAIDPREIGRNVSGVFVNAPVDQGGVAPEFVFRGFNNGGVTLRDGVARGFLSSPVELVGVERTEFVKGVTSLIYGVVTGASGAAVNYILKKPTPERFAQAGFSSGAFGFHRATLDVNAPLDPEKNLLFRVNIAGQKSDSFIDYVRQEALYLNPILSWRPDEQNVATLRAEIGLSGGVSNFGLPTYVASPLFFNLPRNFYGAAPANSQNSTRRFDVSFRYEHAFSEDWRAAAIIDYYLSDTSYGWFTDLRYDGARSVALGSGARSRSAISNFDAQASLSGKIKAGALTHSLFLGAEHWRFADKHKDRISATTLSPLDVVFPVYPAFVDFSNAMRAQGDDSAWINAAFAQDLIDVGQHWRALVGARYDYLASFETINDPSGALTGAPTILAAKGFNPRVSPRAGLMFRPIDALSLHAGYAQSFIPNTGVRIADGKLAPPEQDALYEIGVRQSFLNSRVELDIGVFDVTRKNIPGVDPFNPSGFYSTVTGTQHSHGVETSGTLRPLPHLQIGFAATLLHALVTKDSNTPSQTGSDLLGAPRRTYNVSANYAFDSGPLKGLSLGANFNFASETQAVLPNRRGFVVAPTKNLSASISYVYNEHLSFSLSAANLLDLANFTSSGVLLRGEPRSINGVLSYHY